MRSAPAWAKAARSSCRKKANPCSRRRSGSSGGIAQSWPCGLKASGGAPRLAPCGEELRAGPGLGAAAGAPEREIGIEADRHAGALRGGRGGAELAIELELHEAMEIDLARVLAPEGGDRGRARIAQLARPDVPVEAPLALRGASLAEREERRKIVERLALALAIRPVGPRARAGRPLHEAVVQRAQDLALRRGDARVLDARRSAQLRELALEARLREPRAGLRAARELGHAQHVEVELAAVEPADGRVGGDVRAAVPERVERRDADEIRALAPGDLREAREIGEIAGAEVARAAQRIEVGPDPEAATARELARDRRAARRRAGELLGPRQASQPLVERAPRGGGGRARSRHRDDMAASSASRVASLVSARAAIHERDVGGDDARAQGERAQLGASRHERSRS